MPEIWLAIEWIFLNKYKGKLVWKSHLWLRFWKKGKNRECQKIKALIIRVPRFDKISIIPIQSKVFLCKSKNILFVSGFFSHTDPIFCNMNWNLSAKDWSVFFKCAFMYKFTEHSDRIFQVNVVHWTVNTSKSDES